MKRIGIQGGSFNPGHLGHSHTLDAARKALSLDEAWFWVSTNPAKNPFAYAAADQRTKMLELLAAKKPWLKIVNLEKDFHNGVTATSLTTLQAMRPKDRFIWLMSDDSFATFHTWQAKRFKVNGVIVPDWQYIMHNFPIAIMRRPAYRAAARKSPAAAYGRSFQVDDPVKIGLEQKGWGFINNRTSKLFHTSSTRIKEDLLLRKRPVPGLTRPLENYIYENHLYAPNTDFNAAAQTLLANNNVRLHAFLLLASTANLIKSIGLHTDTFNPAALLHRASVSWDKSSAKGDFMKFEDVPGEIADCQISLYHLARPLGIALQDGNSIESQKSVTDWCDVHYPDRSTHDRLNTYIEELTELCVCEGLEKHRLINLLRYVFEDPQADDMPAAFEKNHALVKDYAEDIGDNISSLLDQKMLKNRTRTPAQSAERCAAKETLFTREPL